MLIGSNWAIGLGTVSFQSLTNLSPLTCRHTSTGCSSEQQPSTGVRSIPTFMLPVVSGINASWHPQKQTMPCLIPPCWSRRPAHTTWHRDNKQSRHPFSEQAKQLTSDAHGKTNRVWAEWTKTWYNNMRQSHYTLPIKVILNQANLYRKWSNTTLVSTTSTNNAWTVWDR